MKYVIITGSVFVLEIILAIEIGGMMCILTGMLENLCSPNTFRWLGMLKPMSFDLNAF